MDLEKMIKDLIQAGKSNEEISKKLLEANEALEVKEILSLVSKAHKAIELEVALKEKEADEKAIAEREEIKAKVKESVNEELKSIGILDGKFKVSNEKIKKYDYATGEVKEYDQEDSEAIQMQGKLIKAMLLGKGGLADAEAISKDIDAQNAKAANRSDSDAAGGYAVSTPVDNQIHELIYASSVAMQNFNTDVIMKDDKIYPVMSNAAVSWIADQDTALTQTTPTFTNPTTTMYRAGAFSYISNKLIGASDADVVSAFIRSYGAAFARFVDAQIFIGNVTGNSDKIDGLVWNANVNQQTAIALSALGLDDIKTMLEAISDEATNVKLFGNRKVKHQLGLDENTGGMNYFPQVINGGAFSPLGTPFVENTQITNVLDVGGDNSTGGTDTVIMAVDCDAIMLGLGQATRIETSDQFRFTTDQITIRGIKDLGYCALHASGASIQNLELTGAS